MSQNQSYLLDFNFDEHLNSISDEYFQDVQLVRNNSLGLLPAQNTVSQSYPVVPVQAPADQVNAMVNKQKMNQVQNRVVDIAPAPVAWSSAPPSKFQETVLFDASTQVEEHAFGQQHSQEFVSPSKFLLPQEALKPIKQGSRGRKPSSVNNFKQTTQSKVTQLDLEIVNATSDKAKKALRAQKHAQNYRLKQKEIAQQQQERLYASQQTVLQQDQIILFLHEEITQLKKQLQNCSACNKCGQNSASTQASTLNDFQ